MQAAVPPLENVASSGYGPTRRGGLPSSTTVQGFDGSGVRSTGYGGPSDTESGVKGDDQKRMGRRHEYHHKRSRVVGLGFSGEWVDLLNLYHLVTL